MAISLDNYLGYLSAAVKLRSQRSEVLSSNLANADTPGYKARDFDFQSALGAAMGKQPRLTRTQASHLNSHGGSRGPAPDLQYRSPHQPSLDGNTVDTQTEKTQFAENAMMHQASLTFLNSRIRGLMNALKGE